MRDEEGLSMSIYETNRAKIPLEEFKKYEGQWVAITMDGSRILAGAPDLLELDERLIAAGVDPEQVGYERIEWEDSYLGGAEFQ
jgi:hypothetical protein